MSTLALPGGFVALVDNEDLDRVSEYRWSTFLTNGLRYVNAKQNGTTIYMHRLVVGATAGEDVDHRNGDGLDNHKANLRRCPHALNLANQRPQKGRTSQFKGVSLDTERGGKWAANIKVNRRQFFLGRFTDETAAARAYDAAALAAWGEFARPNFPAESGF